MRSRFPRNSSLIAVATFALVAGSLTGCTSARDYEGFDDDSRFERQGNVANFTDTNMQILGGRLAGDIGALTELNDDAVVNASHDANLTTLEILVQNERGSAMNALNIYGGITHAQMEPGTRLTFDMASPDYSGDDVYIDGIACSGTGAPYDWSYDEQLEQVTVEVQGGPDENSRRLFFTTTVDGQDASGVVDLRIEP